MFTLVNYARAAPALAFLPLIPGARPPAPRAAAPALARPDPPVSTGDDRDHGGQDFPTWVSGVPKKVE